MKNIFLDCGTHHCEGLTDFYKKGIIDNTFEIHTFEANPACNVEERVKLIKEENQLNITTYNKAVWVEDGVIYFNQENHTKSKSGSPTDNTSNIDGWGSSIDGIGYEHNGYETKVKVPSINFSKFVSELPDANIICKMDIEGAEFAVLRHMIQEGTITRIKEIYIEFHEVRMKNESVITKKGIINTLVSFGLKVHLWN
jgi:FkbM family methyltransferase